MCRNATRRHFSHYTLPALVVALGLGSGVGVVSGPGVAWGQSGGAGGGSHPLHEVWREPITTVGTEHPPSGPPWPVTEYSTARPSDQAVWIEGYWDYDFGAKRYVWVPGTWRIPPPGRTWITGYWAQGDDGWYRVPGFWTPNSASPYRPDGPPDRTIAEAPGRRPSALHFWVPGHYVPAGGQTVWKPGFWSKLQRGWTWIRAAWLERPEGWAYQDGYWLKDEHLLAARERASGGRDVAGLVRPTPNRLGGPITDAEALLQAWAAERSYAHCEADQTGRHPPHAATGFPTRCRERPILGPGPGLSGERLAGRPPR